MVKLSRMPNRVDLQVATQDEFNALRSGVEFTYVTTPVGDRSQGQNWRFFVSSEGLIIGVNF